MLNKLNVQRPVQIRQSPLLLVNEMLPNINQPVHISSLILMVENQLIRRFSVRWFRYCYQQFSFASTVSTTFSFCRSTALVRLRE